LQVAVSPDNGVANPRQLSGSVWATLQKVFDTYSTCPMVAC
jgi:hypothetical protein